MKRRVGLWSVCLVLASSSWAAEVGPEPGRIVEGIACASDPSQTYSVYLPTEYVPQRSWPAILVFDPRGRSRLGAELFLAGAERFGWVILSADGTRSDADLAPNRLAVNALWPELRSRYSVDPRRVYAAGFSGTVAVAFLLGKETNGLAGVVAAGGRDLPETIEGTGFAVFGTVGDADFNNLEMRSVHRRLTEQGNANRLVVFSGEHSWMPAEVAETAVEWLEIQAMRSGLRPVERGLVEAAMARDLDRADDLLSAGRALESYRLLVSIVADYSGLSDVAVAANRATRLEGNPEVASQRKVERRWDEYERRYLERMGQTVAAFLSTPRPMPPDRLARELDIHRLQEHASKDDPEGFSARRMLAMVDISTSFYLTRDLLRQGRPGHAASVLGVACRIREDDPVRWYNRACALALDGRPERAVESLARAVELGFGDVELMRSDPDLEGLRDTEEYRLLLEKAESSVAGS